MANKIVEVRGLSHRYSVNWAIRDINFEIDTKGVFGLLGSNGAGKSTTMNIICNVLTQTKGDVFINGVNLRKDPIQAKKFIGFLPQKAPLHTDMTVDEYLYHCADIRLMPKADIPAAVERAKEKCGITHFSKRVICNLSGGYQQRVGIAQAIVHKPDVVILDEPTNGLDPNQIVEIRHLIKDIAEERTVILSTHILPEVQATCDHILMVELGKLVFAGSVDEFDNYIVPNTILLSLANAPSIDVLRGIEGVAGVEALDKGEFRIRFTDAQEVTERLVTLSSRNRWQLVEIRQEKSSLDTIFAELSKKAR